MQLDQRQAQALFDAGGFFILPLERQGQEFGIDGSIWAVKSFAGIKFLPPGLHLFLYSAPSTTNEATFGGGIVIRKGIFRFTLPQEIIVREYDNAAEEVRETLQGASLDANRLPNDEISASQTIISKEYLRSLDPKLAPYPFSALVEWKSLISFITSTTLVDVLGVDAAGDACCDALMTSLADEAEGEAMQSSLNKKMFWGKPRSEQETSSETCGTRKAKTDKVLQFPIFDLKRSWRPGAEGEELSRDSRDKNWLLGNVITENLAGEDQELLAQLQLAFILFTQLHNFSALEAYKRYITLLCQSPSSLLPSTDPSSKDRVPLVASFLSRVLIPHLEYLRSDFFEEDLPDFDTFLLQEMATLRMSLRAANRLYMQEANENFAQVKEAWTKLAMLVSKKFGWHIGGLDSNSVVKPQRGRLHYNLLAPPDDEDEYTEDGEDAPVVVDL